MHKFLFFSEWQQKITSGWLLIQFVHPKCNVLSKRMESSSVLFVSWELKYVPATFYSVPKIITYFKVYLKTFLFYSLLECGLHPYLWDSHFFFFFSCWPLSGIMHSVFLHRILLATQSCWENLPVQCTLVVFVLHLHTLCCWPPPLLRADISTIWSAVPAPCYWWLHVGPK